MIKAPIRESVEVLEAARLPGKGGFLVRTSKGDIEAQRIMAATGAFRHPVIPAIAPLTEAVTQIHSFLYKNSASRRGGDGGGGRLLGRADRGRAEPRRAQDIPVGRSA
ncbi:MAG: hypothetical protein Q4P24_03375 [Rhodobacterales bacterium]|nr:hypothetical protein [Rhodobacterales bacterium]